MSRMAPAARRTIGPPVPQLYMMLHGRDDAMRECEQAVSETNGAFFIG